MKTSADKIADVLEKAIYDFNFKWCSHEERQLGLSEYAKEIVGLFTEPTTLPVPEDYEKPLPEITQDLPE